ncbi:Alpha/Beta hydrolase protein, partial [Vararia minispora EC-137]
PPPPPLKPGQLPNSFPVDPNITATNTFDTSWQNVFEVTQGLPNISFALARNFAGSLPNGPMLIDTNAYTISQNARNFADLIDIFWVDQPVGVGYSTVDSDGYVNNENDVANDFTGFLTNLVKVFPSLAVRPLYLAGEDYAGVYISYISQTLMSASSPPVNLDKIVIGNGLLGDFALYPDLSTISILESFPQLVNFDESVFNAFSSKANICGYNLGLTYPQTDPLPSLPAAPRRSRFWSSFRNNSRTPGVVYKRECNMKRQSPSLGNELDPFYGCALFDEMIDYAANFTNLWAGNAFDLFDVSNALNPKATFDGGVYFNSLQVRLALHAPFSKNWTSVNAYPFGSTTNTSSSSNIFGDPSPPPATFFENLVSAAIGKNVSVVLYSGSKNAIANHHALEVLIQNTTFAGTRGFTRKPSTTWNDDAGNVAGIVHTERGLTYALFNNVGALVPRAAPNAAYTFFRDYVLKSSSTGTITIDSNGNTAVLGGENSAAAADVPRVASAIFAGTATTVTTILAPSATVLAWQQFVDPRNSTSGSAAVPSL